MVLTHFDRVPPGEQCSSRRRADRRGGQVVGKLHAVGAQRVDVRRRNRRIAETTNVAVPEVVHEEHDKVWTAITTMSFPRRSSSRSAGDGTEEGEENRECEGGWTHGLALPRTDNDTDRMEVRKNASMNQQSSIDVICDNEMYPGLPQTATPYHTEDVSIRDKPHPRKKGKKNHTRRMS